MHIQALSHSISKKHSDKIDLSEKNADFSALVGWHHGMAMSLEKSKKLKNVNKPLHPSTNPEIFSEDWSIRFWATGSKSQPIKFKKYRKNWQYMSPFRQVCRADKKIKMAAILKTIKCQIYATVKSFFDDIWHDNVNLPP